MVKVSLQDVIKSISDSESLDIFRTIAKDKIESERTETVKRTIKEAILLANTTASENRIGTTAGRLFNAYASRSCSI